MKKHKLLRIALALLAITMCLAQLVKAQEDERCRDVLQKGIFNVVRVNTYDKLEENYYHWIKTLTKDEAKKATALGLDLTLPVKGVPVTLGGDFNDEQWNKWVAQREELTTYAFKRETVIERFSRTADQGLVNAWRDCMKSREQKIGLRLDTSRVDDKIIVTLSWTIPGNEVALIEDWAVTNATINEGTTKPERIENLRPLSLIYNITERTKHTIFAIRTNRGTVTDIVFPQLPPATRPLTVRIALKEVVWEKFLINRLRYGSVAEIKLFGEGSSPANREVSPALSMIVVSSQGQGLLSSRFTAKNDNQITVTLQPNDTQLVVSAEARAGGQVNNIVNLSTIYSIDLKDLRILLASETVITRRGKVSAMGEGKGEVMGEVIFDISLVP